MSTIQQPQSLIVTIPFLGECTLLPVDILPHALRTYEKIHTTARELDLKEFDELSKPELQEIFKALAFKISERGVETTESVTVMISGTYDAYPLIDIGDKNQKMKKCVLSMDFFFWQEARLSDAGVLIGGPVDRDYTDVPIDEYIPTLDGDSTYCLFRGT